MLDELLIQILNKTVTTQQIEQVFDEHTQFITKIHNQCNKYRDFSQVIIYTNQQEAVKDSIKDLEHIINCSFKKRNHQHSLSIMQALVKAQYSPDFICKHWKKFSIYDQCSVGDIYQCALKYNNLDLILLAQKQNIPHLNDKTKKHVIYKTISNNNVKMFKVFLEKWDQSLNPLIDFCITKNAVNIFNYLLHNHLNNVKQYFYDFFQETDNYSLNLLNKKKYDSIIKNMFSQKNTIIANSIATHIDIALVAENHHDYMSYHKIQFLKKQKIEQLDFLNNINMDCIYTRSVVLSEITQLVSNLNNSPQLIDIIFAKLKEIQPQHQILIVQEHQNVQNVAFYCSLYQKLLSKNTINEHSDKLLKSQFLEDYTIDEEQTILNRKKDKTSYPSHKISFFLNKELKIYPKKLTNDHFVTPQLHAQLEQIKLNNCLDIPQNAKKEKFKI